MYNLTLIVARFISSLGTVLSSASVIFYVASKNRENELPLILFAYGIGTLVGSLLILPRLRDYSLKQVLLPTTVLGGALTLTLGVMSVNSFISFDFRTLLIFNLFLGALSILDNSTSQASLGGIGIPYG